MLVIDAYNALHVTGVLPPEVAGIDARGLAELISASRFRAMGGQLVCDGAPPPGRHSGEVVGAVRITYAGGGRDADSVIERLIDESTAPKRLLVVSSDRRLQRAARRRRCKWLPSGAFLQQIAADAGRAGRLPKRPAFAEEVPLAPSQIKRWMDEFGPEAERLLRAAGTDQAAAAPSQHTPPTPGSVQGAVPGSGPRPKTGPGGTGGRPDRGRSSGERPQKPSSRPKSEQPEDPAERALLEAALQEWPGRLSLDDLEMSKWLKSE